MISRDQPQKILINRKTEDGRSIFLGNLLEIAVVIFLNGKKQEIYNFKKFPRLACQTLENN